MHYLNFNVLNEKNETKIYIIICTFLLLLTATVSAYSNHKLTKEIQVLDTALTETTSRVTQVEELNVEINELRGQMAELNSLVSELYERQIETKILEMQIEMNEVEKLRETDLKEYYLEYIDLTDKYSFWIDKPTTIYEAMSEEEIMYLWRMVESETGGAPFECRVNVADVAFNRVEAEEWPNSIKEVITQSNQFCYTKTQISEETKMAVEYAFMFPDETKGALSFHSNKKTDTFGKYVFLFEDQCGHKFYGHQPRGGEG